MTGTWDDDSEQKSEVPEYSAARGEPNSELMQTDHDVVKEIANTGPLDKETLDSIGLNAELLQIFVQRFANITLDDDRDDKDKKWVKMLASERLERAELINNISGNLKYSVDTPMLDEIPDENQIVEGNVFPINRYEDQNTSWVASLYIRQHLVDRFGKVQSFLNNNHKNRLYVTGAPGCGKTCFFWLLAGVLMKKQKRVLFIQYSFNLDCQIWVIEDSGRKRVISPAIDFDGVKIAVEGLLNAQTRNFDVCICDGVRSKEETCKKLLGLLKRWTGDSHQYKILKLILVTSLQFDIPISEQVAGNDNIIIDSWREDDYEKAVLKADGPGRAILLDDWTYLNSSQTGDDPRKTDDEKLLEVVRQKYEYAGGCARFMFDRNMEELKQTLDELFDRVGHRDCAAFAHETSMPESMTDAVHSLMQQFSLNGRIHTSVCTPVSKVVLSRAYTKCGDELTAAIERVALVTKNGSFFGWASELKQKDILRSVLKANLAAKAASSIRKRTKGNRTNVVNGVENSKLAFFPVAEADFVETIIIVKGGGNLVSGSVIWCTNFYQGLFDAAFYFENTLVTLKFTGADDHLLRLEHVKPLRTAILNMGGNVEKIVHLCVATKDNNEGKFKFSDPTDVKRVMTRAEAMADAAWSFEAGTCSRFQQRRQQGVIVSLVVKKQLAQTIEWLRSKIKACKWWREKSKSSWTQEVIKPSAVAAAAPTFIVAVDATSAFEKTTRIGKNGVFLGDDAKFYEISNAFSTPVGLDKMDCIELME